MEPYMSTAMGAIQAQHNAVTSTNVTPMIHRSRWSRDSRRVLGSHHSMRAPVDARQMRMRAIKLQGDWPRGFGFAVHHFAFRKFETGRHGDAHRVRSARDRVADRLSAAFDQIGNAYPRG